MSQKQGGRGASAAGKGKKPGKAGAEEKREDVLQAVILADSFQQRFMPFTLEKPRCLLPLANTPLIEYTLEFLAMSGVQDVYIYCGAHEEQIENYINESPRWSPNSSVSPFQLLEFIRVADAHSVGDFLRDLDKRGIIGGDFLLVHGDLVANIPLDAALAKHRARREANRDAIMTVVLRTAGEEDHRTKSQGVTPLFALDGENGRCLHYEEMHPLQSNHYLTLDPTLLEDHRAIEIRSDLIDCGIDICTPEVLALWSESFDYELLRSNFLHGVLKDFALNGKMIYTEVVEEGYAARANTLQMYDAITKDILGRWTYPLVPECNLVTGHSYKMGRRGMCLEDNVTFESNHEIQTSVLGRDTRIGRGTKISNSIIGRGCKIGDNVQIENSYVWDGVTVEDGSTVQRSVIASDAKLGAKTVVPVGSLISFGVQIAAHTILPSFPTTVLSRLAHDGKPAQTDTELVGPGGIGAAYVEPVEESDDDEDSEEQHPDVLQKSLIYSLVGLDISTSSISTLASTDDDMDDDDLDSQLGGGASAHGNDLASQRTRLSSFGSLDDDSMGTASAFHADAVQGLLDALRADSDSFDGAKLEFMGLRLANDASDHMMRRAVATAFARRAAELCASGSPNAAERTLLTTKGATKFIREVGVGVSSGGSSNVAEQIEFVTALQKAMVGSATLESLDMARAGSLFAAMLQKLYNADVLEEEGILGWWADARAGEGDGMAAVKKQCTVLVKWFEEAEEGDSDEDDEDDDDADDDD